MAGVSVMYRIVHPVGDRWVGDLCREVEQYGCVSKAEVDLCGSGRLLWFNLMYALLWDHVIHVLHAVATATR